MKIFMTCLFCILFFIGLVPNSLCEVGNGAPLKYIASCELDLNNDGDPDIAFLVETLKGRELIVLLRTKNGYKAFLLSRGKPNMYLSCHFGKYVEETLAGKGEKKGKVYKTNGTYLKLTQPEGSSVAFFWNNNTFQEVWTSD